MTLEVSPDTQARVLAKARAQGLEVDAYLQQLMEAEEQRDFVAAVERGLEDVEAGRVGPAREALSQLGTKLGISR